MTNAHMYFDATSSSGEFYHQENYVNKEEFQELIDKLNSASIEIDDKMKLTGAYIQNFLLTRQVFALSFQYVDNNVKMIDQNIQVINLNIETLVENVKKLYEELIKMRMEKMEKKVSSCCISLKIMLMVLPILSVLVLINTAVVFKLYLKVRKL